MEKFTASNGLEIEFTADGYLLGRRNERQQGASGLVTHATAGPEGIEALREFFRAERDAELGRWRWPENPEYVVYPWGKGVAVVYEATGGQCTTTRERNRGGDIWAGAAAAFFAAHPEPRPWEDAKPGEVWAITYDGEEGVFLHSHGAWYGQGGMRVVFDHPLRDSAITAGRRVWPEGETTT